MIKRAMITRKYKTKAWEKEYDDNKINTRLHYLPINLYEKWWRSPRIWLALVV